MRAAIFKGPGSIEVGERPDPRHRAADRRRGAGRDGLRVRFGPLVLPRRVRARRRLDRPRVHRCRRRRRRRRRPGRSRRPGRRAVHLQRHVVPALPARLDDLAARAAAPSATAPSTAARAKRCGSRSPAARSSRSPARVTPTTMLRSLLTLSDVMSTGHHAAVSGGVKPGDTVAVVGDGAVGLSRGAGVRSGSAPSGSSPSAATPDRQQHRPSVRRHRHRRRHAARKPTQPSWS